MIEIEIVIVTRIECAYRELGESVEAIEWHWPRRIFDWKTGEDYGEGCRTHNARSSSGIPGGSGLYVTT
jgi:hypothetical protein